MTNPAKTAWLVRIGVQRLVGGRPHAVLYVAACEDAEQAVQAVMARVELLDETIELVRKLSQSELSELKLADRDVRPYSC